MQTTTIVANWAAVAAVVLSPFASALAPVVAKIVRDWWNDRRKKPRPPEGRSDR